MADMALADSLQKKGTPITSLYERTTTRDETTLPDEIHISLPCFAIPLYGPLVKPCNDVTVGVAGLDITTPFGTKHIPGAKHLRQDIEYFNAEFSTFFQWIALALVEVVLPSFLFLYVTILVVMPSQRQAFKAKLKKLASHTDPSEEHELTPEEKEMEEKKKWDPESENFGAPGNIFRILAVMHPGHIGWVAWGKYVIQGVCCAYMQLFLPVKIVTTILHQWDFDGLKSPIWWIMDGYTFIFSFVALGNLCHVFASKCQASIAESAKVAEHLIAYDVPEETKHDRRLAAEKAAQAKIAASKTDSLTRPLIQEAPTLLGARSHVGGLPYLTLPLHEADAELASLKTQAENSFPWPSDRFIELNETFWLMLDLVINVAMGITLMLAFFLKVATFTGDMAHIAVVSVSLYFVFDLDNKIMQAHPKMKNKYRRLVVRQSTMTGKSPHWITVIYAIANTVIEILKVFGLLMIAIVSWKSLDGRTVIGRWAF